MNKEKARLLGAEINAAMNAIAQRHGMSYTPKGGTFSDAIFAPRGEFRETMIDGKSFEQVRFEEVCHFFFFNKNQFRAELTHNGEKWAVIGFETRRSKFPILLENCATKKKLLIKSDHPEIKRLTKDYDLKVTIVPAPAFR